MKIESIEIGAKYYVKPYGNLGLAHKAKVIGIGEKYIVIKWDGRKDLFLPQEIICKIKPSWWKRLWKRGVF